MQMILRETKKKLPLLNNERKYERIVAEFLIEGWNSFPAPAKSKETEPCRQQRRRKLEQSNRQPRGKSKETQREKSKETQREEEEEEEERNSQETYVELYRDNILIAIGEGGAEGVHGEIRALNLLLQIQNENNLNWKDAFKNISVRCEAKPCCIKCSAILGRFGVSPYNSKTEKATYVMEVAEGYKIPPLIFEYMRNSDYFNYQTDYGDEDLFYKNVQKVLTFLKKPDEYISFVLEGDQMIAEPKNT